MLKEGNEVVPFFTNYGQYSLEGERKAVHAVVNWIKKELGGVVRPPKIREVVEAKVDIGRRVAASPGRILAFVGAATIWAYTNNWERGKIVIGIHKGDKDVDSCRVGYEDSLNETLKVLTQNCMRVSTPLMGMTRKEMALELKESGIPWEITFNCYWYPPCSWKSVNDKYLCPGCRRKQEAMNSVGEPLVLENAPNVRIMNSRVARRDWTKWT
jgi:7-cyano-7-deazaguanine synthase in queuosine biosynthesis